MRKYCFLFIVLACFFGESLKAQDQHFTQFFASPLTLNPALAGQFEGTYRFAINYRSQWDQVFETPFTTYAGAVDLRFGLKNYRKRKQDKFGLGAVFYADKNNLIGFSTNQLAVVGAYHKSLSDSDNSYLSIGTQLSLAQRNVNYENLSFGDQFNGSTGYFLGTDENLPENNFSFSDISIGLNYTYVPTGKGASFYLGGAMYHVTEPQLSFFRNQDDPNDNGDSKLYRKYTAYISSSIPLGQRIELSPRALLYAQGPHMAINAGTNIRFLFGEVRGTALHLGTWARPVKDLDSGLDLAAIIGMIGFEYNNFLIGFSYDANLSDLQANYTNPRSAFELSFAYLGNYDNSPVLCPKF